MKRECTYGQPGGSCLLDILDPLAIQYAQRNGYSEEESGKWIQSCPSEDGQIHECQLYGDEVGQLCQAVKLLVLPAPID